MKIAISGAGVAGAALAFWLRRAGHAPTLIEVAPALRTGGYMIDFWGVGYTVAERMGVLPAILEAGYPVERVAFQDAEGRSEGGFPVSAMAEATGGRFTSLPRGELARILYEALDDGVETLFGASFTAIEDKGDHVQTRLSDGTTRAFDLVVGADGLHSNVRRLVFGPQDRFERQIGYHVAALEIDGYRPRDELVYLSHALPGRQLSRFSMRGDRTMALFVFESARLAQEPPDDLAARKAALAAVFDGMAWEWPAIREALMASEDLYFDRVSQIEAPTWSSNRIALVGDAAACVSLLAGEGTGLGITEAYVLAGELARADGQPSRAFTAYDRRLRRFIGGKQASARGFAKAFAPRTDFGLWVRRQAIRAMAIPGVANLLVGGDIRDDFDLPDYGL